MKKIFLSFWICVFSLTIFPPCLHAQDVRDSVVKIYTTANRMDFYRPWQAKGTESFTGSGVVIAGNRVLTNAHVVSDQTFIQVKKYSDPRRYTAKLVAIGHDCDLAILEVEDKEFFNGMPALEIGELPSVQDTVFVVGYPSGGDDISITKGVVSRIEVRGYIHSSTPLLVVQVDAAVNPGNSGGPVVKDGKLTGIVMQNAPFMDNIGYMIPPPIINHFFKDLEDGHYDGFPKIAIDISDTVNPALREYYKIKDQEGGLLITKVLADSPGFGYLKEGDVILDVDGVPVAQDGTFKFRDAERLSIVHNIMQKQMGETIRMRISRDGVLKDISFPFKEYEPFVPAPYESEKPSFYIYGGLVFTVLSSDLIREWRNEWGDERMRAPVDFVYQLFGAGKLNEENKKQIVVLLNVLPDDINVGYHEHSNLIIDKVNGEKFDSFKDFILKLNNNKNPFTVIESKTRDPIIFENKNIEAIDKAILKRNNIPARFSDDVAGWLQGEGHGKLNQKSNPH